MKPFSKEIIKDIPKIEGCTKQRINETLLNTIDYKIFHEAVLSILYAHALLKKKHFRSNHATLATKDFWKAVMKRAEATKPAYNYQRNVCISLFRKSKRTYFEDISVKPVRDEKNFDKMLTPLSQIKSNLKRESLLLEMRISFQIIKKFLKPSVNSLVIL